MRFSTRTRYGLRFLINLASCPPGQLVQLKELAKAENVSAGYLEQIVRSLKPLGIMSSVRGAAGGYALSNDPKNITLEDIFTHLEGDISPVSCLNASEECMRSDVCTTRCFWQDLDKHMRTFLQGMTLQDFMDTYARSENQPCPLQKEQ